MGQPDFGAEIKKLIGLFAGALGGEQALNDQVRQATGLDLDKDLLSWIGDVALFVHGDSKDTIGGGALIQSKDPATSKATLTKIAAAIARDGGGTRVADAQIAGAEGFQLQDDSLPKPVYFIQAGDKVAITYGEEAAKSALGGGGGLTDAPEYKRATAGLGEGYSPSLYLAMPPILDVAESFGAGGDDYAKAKPYLTILDYVIAGTTKDGGKVTSRTRVGFKPHE
jgi:hypothetical protein